MKANRRRVKEREFQKSKAIRTLDLYDDVAIDRMFAILGHVADVDLVLREAGLSRSELRKLTYDDEIDAALETRLSAVQGTPWRLEGDIPKDRMDFLWDSLTAKYEEAVSSIWQSVPFGYSVTEVIYSKLENGLIGWNRISEKPFEWFSPRTDNELIYHSPGGDRIVDQHYKFFMARRKYTIREVYGQALLSRLYWPWFFRTYGWKFWAKFLERFGSPLLVGKSATSTEEMVATLQRMIQSAAAAVDIDEEVTALYPQSAGGLSFEKFAQAIDRRIHRVILGQTLTSGVEAGGSLAAAAVHEEVRNDRRLSDIRLVRPVVQRMITALSTLNWPDMEPPELLVEDETGLENDRAARDEKLAKAGVQFTEQYLLRAYDFEVGDVATAPAPSPSNTPPSPFSKRPYQFQRSTEFQEAIDSIADATIDDGEWPISTDDIRNAIRLASNEQDLERRLAMLVDKQNPAFAELLDRSQFTAWILGYVAEMEHKS